KPSPDRKETSPAPQHGGRCPAHQRGQGRGRTADLPLFRRTLVPTELPGRAGQAMPPAMATQTGLEPATSAVTGRRANLLRYWAMCRALQLYRTPNGIRTRVTALKGRRPRPLDDGGLAFRPCLQPASRSGCLPLGAIKAYDIPQADTHRGSPYPRDIFRGAPCPARSPPR